MSVAPRQAVDWQGGVSDAWKDLISNTLGGLSYGNVLATIASVFIMFLGIVAALNQVGVATAVTTPVLITILATIGGVIVVGAGGGLIRPMQSRWEGWLNTAERETQNVRAQVQQSPGARQQASQLKDQYQDNGSRTNGSTAVSQARSSGLRDDPSEQTRQF